MTIPTSRAQFDRTTGTVPSARAAAAARQGCVVLGVATALDGLALLLLAIRTPAGALPRGFEVGLSLLVLVPGLLITKTGVGGDQPLGLGVLQGDVVLAGSLLYLGVAMPVFHTGGVSYQLGLSQFVAVLAGLVLGSAALALSGATAPAAAASGRINPLAALRDGVILIVGTILLAIALGQLGMGKLTPPKWNWISFFGITVPGMLILIAREFVKQAYRPRHPGARPPVIRLIVTELMLVGGLAVMLYGSGANLILGKNGYTTGIKGNSAGVAVLVAAAVFLVVVRGMLTPSPSAAHGPAALQRAVVRNLAFALGAIAFIYGERSVVMGKKPLPEVGAAFPAAAVVLLAGLLILIIGRVVAHSHAAAAASRRPPGAYLTEAP